MTDIAQQQMAWSFGGPAGAVSPVVAWSLLGAAAAGGLAWVVASYARTLVALPRWKRATLAVCRLLLLAVILAALAGPENVARTYSKQEARPLAVVIDRSESMTTPDNRRQRRADDARRRWLALEPAATAGFPAVKTYAFADGVSAVKTLDDDAVFSRGKTQLFAALRTVMAEAPPGGWGGVVTLTDGLDTSGTAAAEGSDAVVRAALGAGTPLYFVPGRNRYAGGAFLHLRDWTVPAQVAPKSSFRLEVTIDSFQSAARSVPVRLRVGEMWRPTETLRLDAGRRMLVWTADVAVDAPGSLAVELRIGAEGQMIATAHAEVRVAASGGTRILYYQGALDWGYRFLADILRRDPTFVVTPTFRLAAAQTTARSRPLMVGPSLPETVAGYAGYDVVVLANAAASQFSKAQETALTEWVRGGGVLLFLAPDDAAARGYAGSEMEKMLPVVFGRGAREKELEEAESRARLRRLGNRFAYSADGGEGDAKAMSAFAWEPAARQIFGEGKDAAAPRFINYAHVLRAKPGAEIYARHPVDASPEGGDKGRAILLAAQRYGSGQSAVLTSDALWRWKLTQPSAERGVEKFWQTLFAWLGRERLRELRFDRAPLTVEVGKELVLRVAGADKAAPVVNARQEGGTAQWIKPAGEEDGARLYRWTPTAAGEWKLQADDGSGHVVSHWLRASAAGPVGELSGAPTDEATLAKLAERTGGAVLGERAPAAWSTTDVADQGEVVAEKRRPLWHHAWLLGAMMGLYAAELVLRRTWRLL